MFGCKSRCGGSTGFVSTLAAAGIIAGATYFAHSTDAQTAPESAPAKSETAAPRAGTPDLGAMLVGGLHATPGCLGVDTAKFSSGKNTIFAWFENREAVLNWYYSEPHKAAMKMFFPGGKSDRKPLEGIPEDYTGPILAIAAITFAGPEEQQKTGRPFSQISIELYAPLKGGLSINGTLAPASMKVAGGKDVSDDYAGAKSEPQAH